MKKEKSEKKQAGSLATSTDIGAASILAAAAVGAVMLVNAGKIESKLQLFILYGVMALTFALMGALYLVGNYTVRKNPLRLNWLCSQQLALAISVLVFAVCVVFLVSKHIFSGVWMSVSGKTAYAFFTAACAILTVFVYRAARADMGEKKTDLAGKLVIAGSSLAALAVICVYSYIPNIINRPFYEQYHYPMIMQSIYNVGFSEPYAGSSSLYGHYALFFWPVLKLFGHGPRRVALLLAGCSAVTEAVYIYLVLKLTKNTTLRALLIFVSGYFLAMAAGGYYAAVYPIRVLWPMIILAYIVWSCDHVMENSPHGRQYIYIYIIGYVLCGLAITWNTDSGLIAAVVYTAYIWVSGWKDNRVFSKKMFKVYALTILGCVCAVAGMVVIVNLYELLCGGKFSIRACFFPMLGASNTVLSVLRRVGMYYVGPDWLTPVCVFIVTEGLGLFRMCVRRRFDAKTVMLVCFPLMGLGQSYYYLDRSIAGWNWVDYYLFLCLGLQAHMLLTARHKTGLYHSVKRAGGGVALFIVCMYALNLVIGAKDLITPALEGGWNSMDSLYKAAEEVQAVVPKDTYAFGIGTQELYACLGWDPQYHHRDPETLTFQLEGDEDIYAEISAQDRLLIHNYDAGALNTLGKFPLLKSGAAGEPDGAGFVKVAEFPAGNPVFWYMEKMEPAGVVAEQTGFSLQGDANLKLSYLPVTIKENTVYKVDLTLAGDVSAAALGNLIVDFVGPDYDRAEQEASSFVQDGVPAYTFYFNTGTFGAETMDCLARVFLYGMDSPVNVSAFRITEMARVQ